MLYDQRLANQRVYAKQKNSQNSCQIIILYRESLSLSSEWQKQISNYTLL